MTYIIAQPCIGTKDTACVAVCPVDCIHPTKDNPNFDEAEMLYIDPDVCIEATPQVLAPAKDQARAREAARLQPLNASATAPQSLGVDVGHAIDGERVLCLRKAREGKEAEAGDGFAQAKQMEHVKHFLCLLGADYTRSPSPWQYPSCNVADLPTTVAIPPRFGLTLAVPSMSAHDSRRDSHEQPRQGGMG